MFLNQKNRTECLDKCLIMLLMNLESQNIKQANHLRRTSNHFFNWSCSLNHMQRDSKLTLSDQLAFRSARPLRYFTFSRGHWITAKSVNIMDLWILLSSFQWHNGDFVAPCIKPRFFRSKDKTPKGEEIKIKLEPPKHGVSHHETSRFGRWFSLISSYLGWLSGSLHRFSSHHCEVCGLDPMARN